MPCKHQLQGISHQTPNYMSLNNSVNSTIIQEVESLPRCPWIFLQISFLDRKWILTTDLRKQSTLSDGKRVMIASLCLLAPVVHLQSSVHCVQVLVTLHVATVLNCTQTIHLQIFVFDIFLTKKYIWVWICFFFSWSELEG